MSFRMPSKPSTPSEYAVLIVAVSALFIATGIGALVMAYRAPEAKHELAGQAAHLGLWSLGIGVGIAVVFWLFRRFSN
jgi:hypothetical protein